MTQQVSNCCGSPARTFVDGKGEVWRICNACNQLCTLATATAEDVNKTPETVDVRETNVNSTAEGVDKEKPSLQSPYKSWSPAPTEIVEPNHIAADSKNADTPSNGGGDGYK